MSTWLITGCSTGLGPDALAAYRYIADGRANEIAKWEELTTSTNFDT
jgi:hypothetical protein